MIFPENPGEQPLGVFCVIAYNHGLVAELGKHGFNPFPRFGEGPEGRFSVSLVFSAGCFQPDTGRFEKVKLRLGADMALVSEEGAVRVVGLDILQEMEVMHARPGQVERRDALEVMHARPGQVERRDAPVQPADGVQLESVNGCLAWHSIRRRGFPCVLPAHRAAPGVPSGILLPAWNRCRNNPRPHPSPGPSAHGCAGRAGPWTCAGRCIACGIGGGASRAGILPAWKTTGTRCRCPGPRPPSPGRPPSGRRTRGQPPDEARSLFHWLSPRLSASDVRKFCEYCM